MTKEALAMEETLALTAGPPILGSAVQKGSAEATLCIDLGEVGTILQGGGRNEAEGRYLRRRGRSQLQLEEQILRQTTRQQ